MHITSHIQLQTWIQFLVYSTQLSLNFCNSAFALTKIPYHFLAVLTFPCKKNVSSTADNNLFLGRSLFRPHNLGEIFAVGRVTFKSRERNKNKRVTFSFSMITNGGMLKAQYIFIFLNILAGWQIATSSGCEILTIILAFHFCRFCVVIRFFHPRHNSQWQPPTLKDFYTRYYP